MGRVRPITEDDIPRVADLFVRVYRGDKKASSQHLKAFFHRILFRHPWSADALPSLGYQDDRGEIVGFLGVMPRRMSIHGRPVRLALPHTFMVEPDRRGIPGVRLLKEFLEGPQDLSLSDVANDTSRRMWEQLGGVTSLLYSMHWVRYLRPCRYLVSNKCGASTPLAFALRPFCRVGDTIATRTFSSPYRLSRPPHLEEDLSVEAFLACLSEFSGRPFLQPAYDVHSLDWLLKLLEETAERQRDMGTFQKVLVRDGGQKVVGWYLYYLSRTGLSQVVQIGASPQTISEVLDHLFYHAWRQGAIALQGRVVPPFLGVFLNKCSRFYAGSPWVMVHSRRPELSGVVSRGEALLSTLEGECWRWLQAAL